MQDVSVIGSVALCFSVQSSLSRSFTNQANVQFDILVLED